MEKFNLKGKCAIVTGAATGLGKAMANALADAGANIVIFDINKEKAEKTAEEIRKKNVEVMVVKADVTSYDEISSGVKKVLEKFGKIDILINDAGIVRHVKAEEMSLKDWNDVINVNLTGVFIVSQIVGKVMIEQKSGSIINISSMSGLIVNTPQCQCAYNASKAGVILLTKSLATEWAGYNVRVNTIAPGYMNTELTAMFIKDERNKPTVDRWMQFTPMGRVGEPEELGGIAVYLASDASSYVTGSVFTVDGGYTAW